jgi:LCP family protein required for cell wall assembly
MDTTESDLTAETPAGASQPLGAATAATAPKRGRRGKHAGRRKHRWIKWVVLGVVIVLAVAGGLIASTYAYVNHRIAQIHRVHVTHLAKPVPPGKPFNVLLVGSDSRQFVDNQQEQNQFGSPTSQTGQRSDVIIIARFIPADHHVILMSIPRDTYVNIPGDIPNVSGPNRINVAFDTGSPSLLIQTIGDVFHIPIQHYVSVNFEGFADMVNSLGGVYLNFPDQIKDTVSDLNVTRTGCQLVGGTTALALVRSRDLQYYTPDNGWQYDVQGDFSRIRRQDAFFQALISKANGEITNPFGLNAFLSAAQKNNNVSIDQNWSTSQLLSLAKQFRGVSGHDLVEETIPEEEGHVNNQDVLYAAQPYATTMVDGLLSAGSAPVATTTTAPDGVTATTLAPTTTTTTYNPNIVFNTQPEPWNPVPCSPK